MKNTSFFTVLKIVLNLNNILLAMFLFYQSMNAEPNFKSHSFNKFDRFYENPN